MYKSQNILSSLVLLATWLITTGFIPDSVCFKLCEVYGSDQIMREKSVAETLYKSISKVDSIHFNIIIDIIEEYGYPSKNNLPDCLKNAECILSSATAVLLHVPHLAYKNKNVLLKEVANNRLPAETLMIILDKYYTTYEHRSLYGSPFRAWTPNKKLNLNDRFLSDSLRMELGLQPLPDSLFVK
jgi:hypothetical protein